MPKVPKVKEFYHFIKKDQAEGRTTTLGILGILDILDILGIDHVLR